MGDDGVVHFRVARWQKRDGGKTYAYYHPVANGGWARGRGPAPRVLFRLPEVRAAIAAGETIHVAEGEKCVSALVRLGLCATCNDGGAGKWRPEHTNGLQGAKRVVIWRDNDDSGQRHVVQVARAVHNIGVPDVRVVELPGSTTGGDVADWIDARQGVSPNELRAQLEALAGSTPAWQPPADQGSQQAKRSPWAGIRTAGEFLDEVEPDADFLVPNILARGSLTLWFSPRGLGKTHVAHNLAVILAVGGRRVLLLDRDNSRRELRRRLTGWGAGGLATLKVMDRDEAPPLTDRLAWAEFPFGDYDAVIIDAFDSSAEGVGEQDSSRPSLAVGVLLDLAHRASGPAVLVLGNTIKSGSHGRGSGVIEDRADIVFEVRDATDLNASGSKSWWQELPLADRGSWGDRAARRKRRDAYRLAFVPSKFRVGPEPDPFVLEIRLNEEPWACEDVTDAVVAAGELAQTQTARDREAKLDRAAAALSTEVVRRVQAGSPMRVRDDAEPFLAEWGLSRETARKLIGERAGKDWRIRGGARRGSPQVLLAPDAAGVPGPASPHRLWLEEGSILAYQEPCGPPESTRTMAAQNAAESDDAFRPPASMNNGGHQGSPPTDGPMPNFLRQIGEARK
jgi:hypothetical protein